ncbi:PREDICTED: uncharacterized protein LOC105114591 [Populus euphratica]|uniref:Uncharacterized protein LOC105114591 n=1 Tax=Populus euphratica TaxID=75702 RepID=A0AAJ6TEV4_POPEU|nr:PREDICTED: uncharacterized protein LOC105114591 [Populus euphratica]
MTVIPKTTTVEHGLKFEFLQMTEGDYFRLDVGEIPLLKDIRCLVKDTKNVAESSDDKKADCNKIAEVVYDEKLLIHFFQDNLSDITLTWYMRLDSTKVKRWKDLVDAFMRQYKFNIDVGPDRLSLQAMEKDNKESIREYARR